MLTKILRFKALAYFAVCQKADTVCVHWIWLPGIMINTPAFIRRVLFRAKAYVIHTLPLCDWSVQQSVSKPQTQWNGVDPKWGGALREIYGCHICVPRRSTNIGVSIQSSINLDQTLFPQKRRNLIFGEVVYIPEWMVRIFSFDHMTGEIIIIIIIIIYNIKDRIKSKPDRCNSTAQMGDASAVLIL